MTKRRGNGEGTIRLRRDGRWEAALVRLDGTRVSIYAKTRRDVADKLSAAIRARKKGLLIASDRQTVGEYLAAWLEMKKSSVRESTHVRYDALVRVHTPTIAGVQLVRLSPVHIQNLYALRLAAGAAPQSVKHVHRLLHQALDQAEAWGLAPRNATDGATPPQVPHKEMKTLSAEESRIFLSAVAGDHLEALYTTALMTGMRQGELLGLRWRDVDLDASNLQVRQTVQWVRGTPRFGEPKTAQSRRRVDLTRVSIDALRRHRASQLQDRLKVGRAWEELDLVFANAIGRPLDASNVRDWFRAELAGAKLPKIRFHDLRHTAATLLLGRGVHPKIVSEMLGHASIAITLDTYSHVLPTMQREAAAVMDAILGGTS